MFFALMVGAHGSLTPPHRGGPSLMFFTLMMGAPRSSASPPREPVVDVFSVNGERF
jgi:hypothetical protein